jgi:hypothetical protein
MRTHAGEGLKVKSVDRDRAMDAVDGARMCSAVQLTRAAEWRASVPVDRRLQMAGASVGA